MPLPTGYTVAIAQTVLALLLAPGLVGLIRWLKARLQNRRGAPVWQPYLELRKLFAKEVVVSSNASWLFRAAPFVVFASTVAVAFLVPVLAVPSPFDPVGDLLVGGLPYHPVGPDAPVDHSLVHAVSRDETRTHDQAVLPTAIRRRRRARRGRRRLRGLHAQNRLDR